MVFDLCESFAALTISDEDRKSTSISIPNARVFASPHPQAFPFRSTMLTYITNKWSSNVYSKLVKTCKYFYSTHKVYMCDIFFTYIRESEGCYIIDDQKLLYKKSKGRKLEDVYIDLNTGMKLWVTKEFISEIKNSEAVQSFLKYIYRCDATSIILFYQNLTAKELFLLIKFVKRLELKGNTIMHSDGNRLSCAEILSHTPFIETFLFGKSQFIGTITAPNGSLPILKNLYMFKIYFNTFKDIIDFEAWCQFIKLNNPGEIAIPFICFKPEEEDQLFLDKVKQIILKIFPTSTPSNHVMPANFLLKPGLSMRRQNKSRAVK